MIDHSTTTSEAQSDTGGNYNKGGDLIYRFGNPNTYNSLGDKIFDKIQFSKNDSVEKITLELNRILEKMIIANPKQWIWTHNRWKL